MIGNRGTIKRRKKYQKGFAILFASFISAIILLITIGVSRVLYRDSILNAESTKGTETFYFADSLASCYLFGYLKKDEATGYYYIDYQQTEEGGNWIANNFNCFGIPISDPKNFETNIDNKCVQAKIEGDYPNFRMIFTGYSLSCEELTNSDLEYQIVSRQLVYVFGNPPSQE